MKFIAKKENIINAITDCYNVAPSTSPIDVYKYFKLDVENDKITITATDGVITVITNGVVSSNESVSMVVEAKMFNDVIKKLSNKNDIVFEEKKNVLNITQGRFTIDVPKYSEPERFPNSPEKLGGDGCSKLLIKEKLLSNYISKSIYSASKDPLKASLYGLLFEFSEDLNIVATDAVSLVCITDTVSKKYSDGEKQYILPEKIAKILMHSCKTLNGDAKISFLNDYMQVMLSDDVIFYSRLINAKFPAYKAIIPTSNDHSFKVDSASMIKSIERVELSTNALTRMIRMEVDESKITLSAEDAKNSTKSNDECDIIENSSTESISFGFNSVKIKELLKNMYSEKTVISYSSSLKPVIFSPEKEKEYKVLTLLMPIRLQES